MAAPSQQSTVEDKTTAAASQSPAEPNVLETTTSKDGDLPVNKLGESAPTPAPTTPTPAPAETAPEETTLINTGSALASEQAAAVPEKPISTNGRIQSETPIVVSESDVVTNPSSPEHLAEEIETLSGEIQALESKIDRLTGNASSIEPKNEAPRTAEAPKPMPAATTPPPPVMPDKKPTAVNDIYSKVAERTKESEEKEKQSMQTAEGAEDIGVFSGVGTIGEVLAVFGYVIFLAMIFSPFYKQMLADNLWDATRSIGWPTAAISLFLGFVLLLFANGKVILKLSVFLFFLVSVVIYLGISGYGRFLGPLEQYLDSILTFYR